MMDGEVIVGARGEGRFDAGIAVGFRESLGRDSHSFLSAFALSLLLVALLLDRFRFTIDFRSWVVARCFVLLAASPAGYRLTSII
jgi:hypothetical protein